MTPAFDTSTLCQRVYEHLHGEIMADRLPPGTELSEVALSKELSVSRGPIREAMGRLAADGLVTVPLTQAATGTPSHAAAPRSGRLRPMS